MEHLNHPASTAMDPQQPDASERLPHNLPAPLTNFTGRDAERARILEALRSQRCRLITITGVGGVGKTRLAQQIAWVLVGGDDPLIDSGAYFVPLAPLAPSDSGKDVMAGTIARAVGIALSGPDDTLAQLQHYLRDKNVLLVLDNLEHLPAAGALIAGLLESAPELRIIATSRERLHQRGEWLVELAGLPSPEDTGGISREQFEQSEAAALFMSLAYSMGQPLQADDATRAAVGRICRLVAGLPLGIELAASWTSVLSCAEIADEIERSLDFLTGLHQDLLPRHQSLRAVFRSSWSMLSPEEQQAVRRLSIFRGSFTRQAAAVVMADDTAAGQPQATLSLLATLIAKSLVRRSSGGETRYDMLETVRQYAAEQLGESGEHNAVAARHATYYLGWLEARTPDLRGAGQQGALAAIVTESYQLRAAWRWAIQIGDWALLGRAADALFHMCDMQSWFREGSQAFGAARAALEAQQRSPATASVYGRLLGREAWFRFYLGQQAEARALLEQSLAALAEAGDTAGSVFSRNYLAATCSYLGDYTAAKALATENVAVARSLGDAYGEAIACNILGQIAFDQGAYAEAETWSRQSQMIEQRIGNRWSLSFSLANLGKVAHAQGQFAEASRLFAESLAIRQSFGDVRGEAICLNRMGDTALARGSRDEARACYERSLALFDQIGDQWGRAAALLNLGRMAAEYGYTIPALRLIQDALQIALQIHSAPQIDAAVRQGVALLRQAGEASVAKTIEASGAKQPEVLLAWRWPGAAPISQPEALAALAGPPPTPAAPAAAAPSPAKQALPAGLTAREAEVLRLVAQGLTDAQVAERLVLSTRTVSTHLTSIYGKLQVSSRSAATRFALENGLA